MSSDFVEYRLRHFINEGSRLGSVSAQVATQDIWFKFRVPGRRCYICSPSCNQEFPAPIQSNQSLKLEDLPTLSYQPFAALVITFETNYHFREAQWTHSAILMCRSYMPPYSS